MTGGGSTYLSTDSCFGVVRRLFSRSLSSKRVSSALAFAFPCPCSFAVCSDYSFAKGMVVSTVSAAFAPAVPPHSGCFIQKTWTSSPCLTPVCFHSAPVNKLLPTSYGGAAEIQRKTTWTVLTLMCLFLCLSPLFFLHVIFFPLRDVRRRSVFWSCLLLMPGLWYVV